MRSYNRYKGSVCTEKGEDVSTIKKRKKKDATVHWWTIEKKIY